MKGLLLTVDPSKIVSYIIGIVIIVVAILLVVKYLRTKEGKEKLEEFLNEIEGVIRNEILVALAKINFKDIINNTDSLATAEAELISRLYDKVWELALKHLDEVYGEDPLYNIMKENLTREFVQSLAEFVVNSEPVQKLISEHIVNSAETESADELEKEYEEMNKKIEDDTLAEGEEVPEVNLEEAMPDLEPIIPPSEDSSEIDDDVDEVVGEKEEQIDIDQVAEAIAADDEEDD